MNNRYSKLLKICGYPISDIRHPTIRNNFGYPISNNSKKCWIFGYSNLQTLISEFLNRIFDPNCNFESDILKIESNIRSNHRIIGSSDSFAQP